MIETWIIEHGQDTQTVLFLALFVTLALFEAVLALRERRPRRRSRWPTNIALTFINVLALGLLPVTFLQAAQWARQQGVGLLNAPWLPLAAVVVGTLLLRGFISFFTHWLMHRIPLLWRVHRVHHLDTELDVSTTVRFHPLEFFVGLVPGIPLVIAFGLSPWVLLLYELLDVSVTLFSHSNLRLPDRLERVLRYIVVTPGLHSVHHSSTRTETDSNFSAVFPIWDVLFRTFRTKTTRELNEMKLGLEQVRDDRTRRLGWLLASPITWDSDPEPPHPGTDHSADRLAEGEYS